MKRIAIVILSVSALPIQAAIGDEIRHTAFPAAFLGSWAETPDKCTTRDESNIVIEPGQYGDAQGSCAVRWIVETPGSHGPNYAVHAYCTSAAQPAKTQTVNIIIRPQDDGRAKMGRSFGNLKEYQRCPAG
jgi:hypothetical protein